MRTHSAAEREILRGDFGIHVRLEVEDPDGAWRDLSDRFMSARGSGMPDTPVVAGQVMLALEDRSDPGNALSLAPFMETSTMNRNAAGAYAPLLDAARLVRISVASVALGATALPADYREFFLGAIDRVSVASSTVTLDVRDLGARLLMSPIEETRVYGSEAGTAVEAVMQQILDDNGYSDVALYTPTSPGWMIREYEQPRVLPLDALRQLALQIGWDVRFRYDAAGVFRLTFDEPARTKTVPDTDFGPTEYLDARQLDVTDANIRNVVRVYYTDAATGTRLFEERSDAASIARYGRRYMELAEDAASNIDSAAEAGALADAAVSDLATPDAEQAIETMFFWPAELGDLYAFQPNGVHYDTEQRFAVSRLDWSLGASGPGTGRTTIAVRGKPAGAYRRWLKLGRAFAAGPYLMRADDPAGTVLPSEATDAAGRNVEETGTRVDETITPGHDLAEGVGQQNVPGSVVPLVRGFQWGTCRDGDVVQFPAAFAAAPAVVVLPANVAPPAALSASQVLATEILNTQFKAVGSYITPGTQTPRIAQFDAAPADRANAVGEFTEATLTFPVGDVVVAGRLDLNFRVHLTAEATGHPYELRSVQLRLELAFETDTGSGYVERDTRSYFVYNANDDPGGATILHHESQLATIYDAALVTGDKVRIKVKSAQVIGTGTTSFYVEGYNGVDDPTAGLTKEGVSYTTSAGETATSMTPGAAHFLQWIAFEVAG